MQLSALSEWMIDQRQAEVLGAGKSFSVIQTVSGTSVFFSIGSDGRFYATREAQSGTTGWSRIDLGSTIGQSTAVKRFALAQNPETLYFDLAVVATSQGNDQLLLSTGNACTDDAWAQVDRRHGLQWTAIPYDNLSDGVAAPNPLEIDGVYLMTLPVKDVPAGALTCFVDILRSTPSTNQLRLLERYYIKPQESRKWKKHTLPIDLTAGSISSELGRRYKDRVGGIYTFGHIGGRLELIYAPAYDFWNPENPPAPVRLGLPKNATAMAAVSNNSGNSHLFVSGEQGIQHYAPDEQEDRAGGKTIIANTAVAQATHLSAESAGGITALYALNAQGDLFYTTCKSGSESVSSAWSYPVPLISGIEKYSFFLNKKAGNNVIFAHVSGHSITQLTQDPVTRDWSSRAVLLPSTDVDNVIETNSFTTRLTVYEEDNVAASMGTEVLLTSTSPIGVYVNNSYRILSPTAPIRATTDYDGTIKIVQPTQDMSAICYKATLVKDSATSLVIDPADKVKSRIQSIKTGKDLKDATFTQSDGTKVRLVPEGVDQSACDAAAAAIQQLVGVAASLPQSGVPKTSIPASMNGDVRMDTSASSASPLVHLITLSHGNGCSISLGKALITSAKDILIKAGDLFRSILHSAWNTVKSFVVRAANHAYEILVEVGQHVYRAVLDCAAHVVHAFEWVFSMLQVGFEKLKSFLGFIFNWGDIVRTHKVIKNMATQYAIHSVSRISYLQDFVSTSLESLESQLSAWADLPDSSTTVSAMSGNSAEVQGSKDPQTHYLSDKVREGISGAKLLAEKADLDIPDWVDGLDDIGDLVSEQKETVVGTIQQIKKEIIENFNKLTPIEIVKKLLAIVGNLVLETAKNLIVTTLGIIKDLTMAVIEELNKPISIPIVSKLYKSIADEELSIMDLVCLVAAVPSTIIYKAVTGTTPFEDNDSTKSLISAKDFPSIQRTLAEDTGVFKTLTVLTEFAAMAGLTFTAITNVIKIPYLAEGKPEEVADMIKKVSIPTKLMVLLPSLLRSRSSEDTWEYQMDAAVTDIAFLKVCLDCTSLGEKETYGKVSPYIDFAISVLWIVPSVGKIVRNHHKSSSYLALTKSLAYDVALMTGPIVWNPKIDPETKLIVLAVSNGLVQVAGVVSIAAGGLLHDDD